MGCRQHEAPGQGHQSQAVLMPETWSSQRRLSPAEGRAVVQGVPGCFESEPKARDGDALLRQGRAELSPEGKALGPWGKKPHPPAFLGAKRFKHAFPSL